MLRCFNDLVTTRLRECVAYAKEHHLVPNLTRVLDYLGHYSDQVTRCTLYRDNGAKLSFEFVMERQLNGKWERWFNGGLMFEGPAQPLDGSGPAFTVNLGSVSGGPSHGWSTHT